LRRLIQPVRMAALSITDGVFYSAYV